MNAIRAVVLAFAAAAALALAADAAACTVCYGESHDPIIRGAKGAIVFMVGVTYTLLSGGVAAFVLLRRRAKRLMANGVAGTGSDGERNAVGTDAVGIDEREGAF